MKRVEPYAQKIGAEIYPGMPGYKKGMEADGLAHNRAFVQQKMSEGYTIVDIGPDFARRSLIGHGQRRTKWNEPLRRGIVATIKGLLEPAETRCSYPHHELWKT
jgi:hypothetical protein